MSEFDTKCQIMKVDDEKGLVFGFAMICKVDGEPYIDLHDDHIPEDAMFKAASEFMKSDRISGDMHERGPGAQPVVDGQILFAFPLTTEIAKSLDIECPQTGLLIGMKPSPEVLEKFKDGTYTGFSIGGHYGVNEEAEV